MEIVSVVQFTPPFYVAIRTYRRNLPVLCRAISVTFRLFYKLLNNTPMSIDILKEQLLMVPKRVRNGIEFLKLNNIPFEQIDLSTLDMSLPSKDVLGQLYGSYGKFALEHSISPTRGFILGFLPPKMEVDEETDKAIEIYYAALTEEWRKQIDKENKSFSSIEAAKGGKRIGL